MNLEKWVTAFLNRNPDLAGFLCDLGIAHQYYEDGENQRCKFCKKKMDGWDFFWYAP